ncbi:TetR/AcrR family transcriptional regulator [Agromyces sp. Root81]|uniref:TetR/AcrR family transcriptional regulator n=1 Tax=Agromyces sp. Root81 TaxID=1736601 RepID=UPI00138F7421|nr:TetR/AcrR family transcriptional regulator [Agromyces sp. Root81]
MRSDALVTAAMDLFAERGFHATSVADIQIAAGLTGGSGALYKHFVSKDAVLEAGVAAYLESLAERSRTTVRDLPEQPRDALQAIAQGLIASMTADEAVLRVLLRDLDQHPALLERVWDGVLANVYVEMSDWISAQASRGLVTVSDPEATAAVLMGALTQLPILHALIRRTPGDLVSSAYVSSWVEIAARALQVPSAD